LNPLDNGGVTLSNGNLDSTSSAVETWRSVKSTIGVSSGKWYWEVSSLNATTNTSTFQAVMAGIATAAESTSNYSGFGANGWSYFNVNGYKYNSGTPVPYGATWTSANVIGVALDADNGTLTFYKDNSSQGTAFTGLTSGPYFPTISLYASSTVTAYINFGQRPFAYTAPSGFKALCTQNLPTPTIEDGSTAMDVVTYTGTGAALTPTSSLNFSPDLIWIKSRSATTDHSLYDTVRGAQTRLEPNQQPGDVTSDNGVTAFNSNGFTLGTLAQVNTSSATYVGWCWDAGSSNVTNTDGSMTSTVRANTSTGVSIIDFSATNGTVGHGLGVAPDFFVYKTRAQDSNWNVYHKSLGNTQRLLLNLTDAATTSSTYWNNTSPTSTVITLGSNFSGIGSSIIYAFASVASFSSFGQYTGNGSADGPFVYTGFRPRFVLAKVTTDANDWFIYDTERESFNVMSKTLYPNLTSVEDPGGFYLIDLLSNGFKLRASFSKINASATTYVWAAFAENPFSLNVRAR
jgi:hypothetical protein